MIWKLCFVTLPKQQNLVNFSNPSTYFNNKHLKRLLMQIGTSNLLIFFFFLKIINNRLLSCSLKLLPIDIIYYVYCILSTSFTAGGQFLRFECSKFHSKSIQNGMVFNRSCIMDCFKNHFIAQNIFECTLIFETYLIYIVLNHFWRLNLKTSSP